MHTSTHTASTATTASPAVDISITIATCSRSAMLHDALHALLPQVQAAPFQAEFVIVDDRSTDDTAEVLQRFQSHAGVPVTIVPGTGQGVAAARNLAVQHSRGTWIACCDDDQLPVPDWLASLLDCAQRTSADFVGGSMHLHLPAPYQASDFGPRARRLLGEFGLHRPEGEFAPGEQPATNNVLMRTAVVRGLGSFHHSFAQGGEDTELFHRARCAGHALWFAPAARMQHCITERRVTPAGLRWTAMRIGTTDMRMLHMHGGLRPALRLAAARLGVLLVRDLPQLFVARASGSPADILDVRCSLWYTAGVLRSLPALLAPGNRFSRAFLQRMDFRSRNGERAA